MSSIKGIFTLTRSSKLRGVDFSVSGSILFFIRVYRNYYGLFARRGYMMQLNPDEVKPIVDSWDRVARLIIRVTGSSFYTFAGPFNLDKSSIRLRFYYDVYKEARVAISPVRIVLTSSDFKRSFRDRGGVLKTLVDGTRNALERYLSPASAGL